MRPRALGSEIRAFAEEIVQNVGFTLNQISTGGKLYDNMPRCAAFVAPQSEEA
jgi:hypothetical protein